jgi:two-component system, chemotaxis family, CheB/CheR fusion protein
MLNSLRSSRKVARHAGTVMPKKALSRGPARSRTGGRPHGSPREVEGTSQLASTAGLEPRVAPRLAAPFPIVGIGASAGGLEAFRQLLGALPADSGMAYVLVHHLDPRHESILANLLSQSTKMPVSEVKGNIRVEPNRVYVIPPSHDIGIADGMLKLVPRIQTGRLHMPIDYFLRTLAEAQGSQGIGVVLSGTATDGTLGLQAIKAEGGIAFAQDPASAQFDGMPRSAIAAGGVDFIMSPEGIARELTRLARHPYMAAGTPRALSGSAPAPTSEEEDRGSLAKIFTLLKAASGSDFAAYKKTTLRRRIARRMFVNRSETLEAYAQRLEGDTSEIHALYQDCLITVTSFFRDPAVFEALREQVFPVLLENRAPDVPVRVWVPGCATGEEVYSIAIGLLERAGELSRNPSLQIFATDLSESALEKARAGLYPESIAQDVSAKRLQRFFAKVDGGYQISKTVRDACVFARHDLAKDPPFSRMDLISCRNVIIYMEPQLQERVLATFHYALNPGGFLVLGTSESVGASSAFLVPLDEKRRIYSHRKTAGPARLPVAATTVAQEPANAAPLALRTAVAPGIPAEADQVLLGRYAPASVVVDEGLDILEFRGDTQPFLEHGRGQASLNLIRMARKGLLLELRQTIQEARKTNAPSRKEGLRIRYRGQLRDVNLEVLPLKGAAEHCLLVVFETLSGPRRAAERPASSKGRAVAAGNRESARLRQELVQAAEALRKVMEEHEAALEELQSSNEEAVSSNEELQSVNEELQTAKEEVQSANAELATLNRELKERNVQLGQANDALTRSGEEIQRALDFANAIVSTVRGPLLIMDGELRVVKANRAYYDTFAARPEETEGRLLYEMGDSQWNFPSLRTALGEVLPKDSAFEGFEVEREFPGIGRRTMVLNARRLRNERRGSERILLAIEDRTDLKLAEQARDALLVLEHSARTRAEAADQLKDEFVATVSHELRGPLTAMVGWMHILNSGDARDPAVLANGLAAIARAIKAQSRLVADLLDHSRIVTGKLQISRRLVDLAAIAEAAVETLRPAAQAKDMLLELWRDPRAAIVLGDPDRLQQVLWNLVSNAVKFTPRGGRVQIWVGRVGTSVHLRITDTGQGIKESFLPHVFDRFRQAEGSERRRQPGLGLGLAIVRQLVELHGGTVEVQSAGESLGSTFTVVLPIPALLMQPSGSEAEDDASRDLAAPAQPASDPEPSLLSGLHVLVVEDDDDSRESLVRIVQQYGASARGAASAREAITALDAALPDVLVSDIGMAVEDGYDLIREVRKRPAGQGGTLPALAVTAYGGEGDRRKAAAAGFQAHVVKPVAPAELVTAIGRLAGRTGAGAPSRPPRPS